MRADSSWSVVEVMPSLAVGDLASAVSYYQGLGFVREWTYPEGAEATHVGMSFGPVNVMLVLCPDEERRRQNLYFVMRGVSAYHGKLRQALGEQVPDLVDSDYEMRDFAVRDPWGHLLTFGEAI